MVTIPDPEEFEWDSGNATKNEKKHGVTTKEAEEVFFNKPRYVFSDVKHSHAEQRYGMFGKTNTGRLLSLVFAVRGSILRIISVRPMSRKERRAYEKIKANTEI